MPILDHAARPPTSLGRADGVCDSLRPGFLFELKPIIEIQT